MAENIAQPHQARKEARTRKLGTVMTVTMALENKMLSFPHLLLCLLYSFPSLQIGFLYLGMHMVPVGHTHQKPCFSIPSSPTGMNETL